MGKFWVRNQAGTPEIFDHGEAAIMASEFGLRGNGDHTVALQKAANAAIDSGRDLQLPARQINASGTININGPLNIRGTGCGSDLSTSPFGTRIVCSSAFTLFNVDTPYGCEFRDLSVRFPAVLPASAGAVGIKLSASGSENHDSRIINCRFSYCDVAVQTDRAANWDISRNKFYANNIGVIIRNAFSADSGDCALSNNFMTMASGIPGIYGVLQLSAGGLRASLNKMNGGDWSYLLSLEDLTGAAVQQTGILLMSTNSFEGQLNGGILLQRAGAVGTFQFISIVGHEIAPGSAAAARNIYIPRDASATWIKDLVISANVLIGTNSPASIISLDRVAGFCIGGNHFLSGDPGNVKVSTGADATDGVVGRNSSRGTFAANSIGHVSVVDLDSSATATVPNLRGYIDGLILANNGATSIDVAAGVAVDAAIAVMMSNAATLTKSLNAAWAVGSGNGGLDTGAKANNTWYHVYLIRRPDTGVVDALYSTSATAPTMPTNYTQKRRVGSVRTDGGGNILGFVQTGNLFQWSAPPLDVSAANPGTAAVLRTMSVPLGVRVRALLEVSFSTGAIASNPAAVLISDPSVPDNAPTFYHCSIQVYSSAAMIDNATLQTETFTNTSSQVRSRLQLSAAATTLYMVTVGWTDPRGRDA